MVAHQEKKNNRSWLRIWRVLMYKESLWFLYVWWHHPQCLLQAELWTSSTVLTPNSVLFSRESWKRYHKVAGFRCLYGSQPKAGVMRFLWKWGSIDIQLGKHATLILGDGPYYLNLSLFLMFFFFVQEKRRKKLRFPCELWSWLISQA